MTKLCLYFLRIFLTLGLICSSMCVMQTLNEGCGQFFSVNASFTCWKLPSHLAINRAVRWNTAFPGLLSLLWNQPTLFWCRQWNAKSCILHPTIKKGCKHMGVFFLGLTTDSNKISGNPFLSADFPLLIRSRCVSLLQEKPQGQHTAKC